MEIAEPAKSRVEDRDATLDHPAVEDERGVCRSFVRIHPFDNRLPADLFLRVECEADVDWELPGARELASSLDEHEEVRLVVGDAARVEPTITLGELERRRLPELERIGRLDVEVGVAEDRRRRLRALGRRHLADDERPSSIPRNFVCRSAGPANAICDPRSRPLDVAGVRWIGADRRDSDQLGELRAKFLV
jgi:hypothetical protein